MHCCALQSGESKVRIETSLVKSVTHSLRSCLLTRLLGTARVQDQAWRSGFAWKEMMRAALSASLVDSFGTTVNSVHCASAVSWPSLIVCPRLPHSVPLRRQSPPCRFAPPNSDAGTPAHSSMGDVFEKELPSDVQDVTALPLLDELADTNELWKGPS
jgi:hypothetical protein